MIAWAPAVLDVLGNLVLRLEAVQVALAVKEAAPVILTVPTHMTSVMVVVVVTTPMVTSTTTVAQVTSLVTSSGTTIWKTTVSCHKNSSVR